jgi:hypothetical protein
MRCDVTAALVLLSLSASARADVWEASPEEHPYDEPIAAALTEPARPYVRPAKPALSPVRIAVEVLVGGAAGVGMVLPALAISSTYDSDLAIGLSVYGALAVGSTLGVAFIGNLGDESGTRSAALAGALIGTIPGVIATIDIVRHDGYHHHLPPGPILLCAVTGLVTPTLGAVIGFNLSRRWDSSVRVVPTATSDGSTTMFGVGGSF